MLKRYVLDKISRLLIRLIERPRYLAKDFGEFHATTHIDKDVYISHPKNTYLGDRTAIYRGTKIFCANGIFELGKGSHLSGDVYINAGMGSVKIGKGTAVGPKTVIISHSNDYAANTPITETYKTVDIEIGDDVFIGAGVVILPGTIIGDKAVIGAGAVVTKSVASGIVLAGVPGRKIGTRYEK